MMWCARAGRSHASWEGHGLLDLMWEREIESAPWDTPERAAALKKRLRGGQPCKTVMKGLRPGD